MRRRTSQGVGQGSLPGRLQSSVAIRLCDARECADAATCTCGKQEDPTWRPGVCSNLHLSKISFAASLCKGIQLQVGDVQVQGGHLLNGEGLRQGCKDCRELPITDELHDDAVTKKELWQPAL